MPPTNRAPRLILACLQGLGLDWWLGMDLEVPLPFLRGLTAGGAWAGVEGFPAHGRPWGRGGDSFWRSLSAHGIRLGLVDLPGLEGAEPVDGFAIAQAPGNDPPTTHPPELARELGDYPPDNLAGAALPAGTSSQRDTIFARHAALCRIRFEHARRLALEYEVQVLAWGSSALAAALALFPGDSPRPAQMLAQLDSYLAWLDADLSPIRMAVLGLDPEGGQGVILARGQGIEPGARGRLEWTKARDWLGHMAMNTGGAA